MSNSQVRHGTRFRILDSPTAGRTIRAEFQHHHVYKDGPRKPARAVLIVVPLRLLFNVTLRRLRQFLFCLFVPGHHRVKHRADQRGHLWTARRTRPLNRTHAARIHHNPRRNHNIPLAHDFKNFDQGGIRLPNLLGDTLVRLGLRQRLNRC